MESPTKLTQRAIIRASGRFEAQILIPAWEIAEARVKNGGALVLTIEDCREVLKGTIGQQTLAEFFEGNHEQTKV